MWTINRVIVLCVTMLLFLSAPLVFGTTQTGPSTFYTNNFGAVSLAQTTYFNAVYVSQNLIQFDLTGTLALNSDSTVTFTITPSNSQQMELSIIDNTQQLSILSGVVSSSQWVSRNNTLMIYSLGTPQSVQVGVSSVTTSTTNTGSATTQTQSYTQPTTSTTTSTAPLSGLPQPISYSVSTITGWIMVWWPWLLVAVVIVIAAAAIIIAYNDDFDFF